MSTSINDPISVAGVYEKSGFTPLVFKWQRRKFKIDKITLVSDIRDGNVKKRIYSVISGGSLYRLCFDQNREKWSLLAMAV